MEPIDIQTLRGNAKNPRQISKHDYEKLVQSIKRFGDLSGIVYNETTEQLVGGHQRIEAFKHLGGQPIVTERLEQPNSVGTVATGHVLLNDEKYGYRVVRWDKDFETAANIAANRIQGDWDQDLLARLTYELSQLDNSDDLLALSGQTDEELKRLINMVAGEPDIELPDGDKPGFQTMSFTLSDDQAAIVNEAMTFIKESKSFEGMENQNSNGNALYFVAREFLDYTNGLKDEPSQTNPS